MKEKLYFVHPTSVVDQGAVIGRDTKIWHFSHVMSNATIGERCNIGQNVFVASDVTIGNNVKIQNNVSLYTGVIVEDDVFLGPSVRPSTMASRIVYFASELHHPYHDRFGSQAVARTIPLERPLSGV